MIKPTQQDIIEESEDDFDKNKILILPQIKTISGKNIQIEEKKNSNKNITEDEDTYYKDLEYLDEKFRLNIEHALENHEKFKEPMKIF